MATYHEIINTVLVIGIVLAISGILGKIMLDIITKIRKGKDGNAK